MTRSYEAPVAQRGFRLGLPDGFIPLPLDDVDLDVESDEFESLVSFVAERFGLSATDESSIAAAASFAQLGSVIGDSGVDYSAIAFYKSPDDPMRPIMVTLTGIAMPSDHHRKSEAVANLLELHGSSSDSTVEEIRLPVGPAAATVTEEQNALVMGDEPIPVLTRQLSAWIPDPDGTTIAVVSVMTNSFQDWEHVCTLALDIFDSFGWEPLSG
ncbi:hypothetical protein [Halopolyspora algeriensis]|uniref:hypothetical protein n=1 Tax=Halopolyspora algeriensis TaxID=1500506 RepID=UPI00115391C0|nr:hypothetical protein [Halopolyspora algeriensis]